MCSHNTDPLQLNQSNLQDFIDCPRRFELKILEETRWPAAHSNPPSSYEALIDLGINFHHLCNQFFIGLDPDKLRTSISNPDLLALWDLFCPFGKTLLDHPHFTEQILRFSFQGHILSAKFDYIASLPDDRLLIIDWKTGSSKISRSTLSDRVQTLLYPFILWETYQELFDFIKSPPAKIIFQYWYPLVTDPSEIFEYSKSQHEITASRISEIISQIENFCNSGAPFPLTENQQTCRFCLFRSFCERSYTTNTLESVPDFEVEDLSNTHFDLDSIKEIEF